MEAIEALARRIDRDRVERARQMSIHEKFAAGVELFEEACEVTRSGIRSLNPSWDEDQVEAELIRRLEIRKRIENSLAG